MAKLTQKEFAALCGTTEAILRSNKARGKIVVSNDKKYDTENPLNKIFFNKYNDVNKKNLVKQRGGGPKPKRRKKITAEKLYKDVVQQDGKPTPPSAAKRPRKTKQERQDEADALEQANYTLRKLKAETKIKEKQVEIEELKLQKLAGKLMPVDLVFTISRIHNQEIFATFKNDADNLASIYCDVLAGGDRKRLADISSKLAEKIDEAVRRAGEVSMASIEQAVDEYKEVRSRGEKK